MAYRKLAERDVCGGCGAVVHESGISIEHCIAYDPKPSYTRVGEAPYYLGGMRVCGDCYARARDAQYQRAVIEMLSSVDFMIGERVHPFVMWGAA